jgi:hypothetical protein
MSKKKDDKTTEKNKIAYFTKEAFSKHFSHLYNNEKYSDIIIKFEEKDDFLFCHKSVLYYSSEFFEKKIDENSHQIIIPKEDDPASVKNIIKFLYTGSFDSSDSAQLVSFLQLSTKFGLKDSNDIKLSGKIVLNSVIDWIEQDLENRKDKFDVLLDNIDFQKVKKNDLKKIYSKKVFSFILFLEMDSKM